METPVNINPDKIKPSTFMLLYINILLVWERSFNLKKTGYSIRSKYLKSFKAENTLDIYVAKSNEDIKEIVKSNDLGNTKNNFFVITSSNSQVYDLFRHLRNSVAHGNYKKQKIGRYNYIVFDDIYREKQTMHGQVKLVNLENFIFTLYKSKT